MENAETAPPQPALHWQSGIGSLRQRMKFALDQNLNTDVHFLVGPEEQLISAHKFVLLVNSSVFERMFTSPGFDQTLGSSPDKPVVVPDISADIFRAILTHMYTESTDQMNMANADVDKLLYAASKYDLQMLCKAIVGFLGENLGTGNAIRVYQLATKYNDKELANRCLKLIDINAEIVLSSDDFLDADRDTFCAIIGRDTLTVAELTIYHIAIEWAQNVCKRQKQELSSNKVRELLGQALYLIRFPIIQPRIFTDVIVPDGLLSDAEIVAIYMFHHASRPRDSDGPPPTKKRHFPFPSSSASSYALPFPITERRRSCFWSIKFETPSASNSSSFF